MDIESLPSVVILRPRKVEHVETYKVCCYSFCKTVYKNRYFRFSRLGNILFMNDCKKNSYILDGNSEWSRTPA